MKRAQGGFTLLEAIVAMVLITGAGLALFAWINGSIASLTHVHDANERSEATLNVLEYMEHVNPMLSPDGQASFGAYSIAWHAEAKSPAADGIVYPDGLSLYNFALYDTRVAVIASGGTPWFDFRLRQVGYKAVRSQAPLS